MRLVSYKLARTPLKTVEDTTLLRTDRCIITALKDTLALQLAFNEDVPGFFMHGSGKLVIDTVVETSKGAFGKHTEKNLEKPFIMISNVEEIEHKMTGVDSSSLTAMGYEDLEAFREKAEEICQHALNTKIDWTYPKGRQTRMFLFPTEGNSCDTLVSTGAKRLVYISAGKVYAFSDDKNLMAGLHEVLLSKRGKTIIISKNDVLIEK